MMRNGTYYVLMKGKNVQGHYKADEFDGDSDAAEWASHKGDTLIREDYMHGVLVKNKIIYEANHENT